MLEQEADDVIERVRDYLKRHGVLIGYDPELPSADFGCDLDHHVAQVRDDPNNHVLSIAIHDEGLWAQLRQATVYRCIVSDCRGSSSAFLLR